MHVRIIDGNDTYDVWGDDHEFMELLWPLKKCTIEVSPELGWDLVTLTILEKFPEPQEVDVRPGDEAIVASDIVVMTDDLK